MLKTKKTWLILALVICAVIITMLMLPSNIGDIISDHDTYDRISAIQITQTSGTNTPVISYYTKSTPEIEEFLNSLEKFKISLSGISTSSSSTITYTDTLYDITVYLEATEPMHLKIAREGKMYTGHMLYTISEPDRLETVLALAKSWE